MRRWWELERLSDCSVSELQRYSKLKVQVLFDSVSTKCDQNLAAHHNT